ncbi:hypothetical protein NEOLEDRAFT_541435 [Neolentinus lepideus HHB14362 ss-1]|uniref:Uncharacterized protein n=1 Tax=Neolentinus lepideus HHB14362 ss-1 TaxID=1314782 RepID=A0A165RC70_9AGAM|nr:hypothetical protein NEOLEDRAFT_541435 [Neolentinus lepideus HHB14362 ss-1]
MWSQGGAPEAPIFGMIRKSYINFVFTGCTVRDCPSGNRPLGASTPASYRTLVDFFTEMGPPVSPLDHMRARKLDPKSRIPTEETPSPISQLEEAYLNSITLYSLTSSTQYKAPHVISSVKTAPPCIYKYKSGGWTRYQASTNRGNTCVSDL